MTKNQSIRWLADLDISALAIAGGKGANLGELTHLDLPTSPGFVILTQAYDAFVEANDLQQEIVNLATQIQFNRTASFENTSAQIQALIMQGVIEDDLTAEIAQAYGQLTQASGPAVAVRSSATAEDLPAASFAGQQESFLNVQGESALLEVVKRCWASLWTAQALAYRHRLGIDPTNVSLAVVVQQLIPADCAGILFTANPLDGKREQILINATWGLGEAIVSGQVTPDTVIVDRSNWEIVSRQTATKTVMTVRSDQGTEEVPVGQTEQNQPVLDDATAIQLARYGQQIEAHFGLPMDIEWAISDAKIAILQARPITSLPPAPLHGVAWEPPRPDTIWMRRQIVEHMPEPLSPLFDELYLQNGLDQSMEAFAAFMGELSGIEINLWDFLDPPFAATVNGYAYTIASFHFSWRMAPLILRVYLLVLPKMIRHLVPRWRDESLPAYQAIIAQWKGIDLSITSDEELLRGVRELAAQDAVYWFAAAVPLGLARMSDAALDLFLKQIPDGMRLTSGSFLRGFPSKTMEAQAQLEAIARKIDDSEQLRKRLLNLPAARLLPVLAEIPDAKQILADLQRYFDRYGHQIYNLDFAAPTLADDPLPVLLSLKASMAHPDRDARTRQVEMAQEREKLTDRTSHSLDPIRRWIFRRLLGWARRYAPYREEALFYVGAAWPGLRRLALELGQRLTEVGSLDDPDDVFYLKSTELAVASADRARGVSRPDLAKQAQDQRTLREARKRLDPPISVPPDGRMMFGPIDMAAFEPKPRTVPHGPILGGYAVSPGQVTARASVIRSPEEFDQMVPDTILVCTTTTPAWTPLFAQAKGLVTDIGGALAHGSIVAREYGIPAVMGTGVATQRIQSGQRILVDGDAGTVTLVDEAGPEIPSQSPTTSNLRTQALLALVIGLAVGLIAWWRKRRHKEN